MCLLALTKIAHDDSLDGGAAQATRGYVRPARSLFSNALNFCRSAVVALVRSPCRYCPFLSELHALKIDLFLRQQGISVDQSDTSMYIRRPILATSLILGSIPVGTFVAWEDLPFPASDFNYNDLNLVFTNVSVSPPDPIAGAGRPGPIFATGRLLG
jgi:hypothetical protein